MQRGKPFFSGNYGSALGSTANAANLIAQAGQAQGQMFANMGQQIGGAIEKYQQNKKEGEAADMQIGAVLESMSPERQAEITSGESELGKSLSKFTEGELPNSKKKALLGSLMTVNAADKLKLEEQRKAQLFQQQQQLLQQQQQANKDRDGFINRLTGLGATGNLNEEGQQAMRDFEAFASPNDQRINPYRDKLLSDPRFQEKKPIMDMEGNRFLNQFATPGEKREALKFMQAKQKQAPTISRVVNMEDGQGGFQQVGVDSAGDPIRSFGPPKPSGMYPTPEEARKQKILIGRTEDAMKSVKSYVDGSSLAIKQAEQANLALRNLPDTTGGITSFVNDMKVLAESVGIDLPENYTEDMKDIGVFRQLTGQFLFDAMSNTKGSITENEMRLFRQISPDIDNSKAANEAMLGLYVKAGERAKGRRNLIRGLQEKDVDPREIERAIEKFDEENSLMDEIQALAPQSTQQTFRTPQGDVKGEVVGTKPNGDKLIKVNGQIFVQPAQ